VAALKIMEKRAVVSFLPSFNLLSDITSAFLAEHIA